MRRFPSVALDWGVGGKQKLTESLIFFKSGVRGGGELCYQSARRWFWQILGMLEILWGSLNWIKLNWGQWMWQRRRKPCANRSWPLWLSNEISTKSCQKIPSHPNQSIGFVELILADAKDREESNHLFEMRDSDWFLFIYKFFFSNNYVYQRQSRH